MNHTLKPPRPILLIDTGIVPLVVMGLGAGISLLATQNICLLDLDFLKTFRCGPRPRNALAHKGPNSGLGL